VILLIQKEQLKEKTNSSKNEDKTILIKLEWKFKQQLI